MDNYTWRPIRPTDLDALAQTHAACLAADGPVSVSYPGYRDLLDARNTELLCAVPAGGEEPIVAAGWVQVRGDQAMLAGTVHPAHRRRGLGTHLLRWTTAQATVLGSPGDHGHTNAGRDGPQ